jgi:hypothetical protein
MFKTLPKKKDKPPEGENRQDGDTDNEAEGLQSNQFTLNSLGATMCHDSEMSSKTSRSVESLPVFTSTPAIEQSKVTAATTETTERLAEIASTASTAQGRPPPPTSVTGMEGIEKSVAPETNVVLPAEAGKTSTTTAKSILRPSTLSEAVAGKQICEGIQAESILIRQSIEENNVSIIAPLLFGEEEQTQNRRRSYVRDQVDRLS